MQDSRKPDGARAETDDEASDKGKSEATTDETLSDIEQTEENSGSDTTQSDSGPSPDGTLDESDEIKDAGPM